MARIDQFLLGYIRIKIDKNDISCAAECFLKNNIAVKIRDDGALFVSLLQAEKVKSALQGNVNFEASSPNGFGGFLIRTRAIKLF